jgi:hypothetical protein
MGGERLGLIITILIIAAAVLMTWLICYYLGKYVALTACVASCSRCVYDNTDTASAAGAAGEPCTYTQGVLTEVETERARQDALYGEQNWTPVEWITILAEEFGEAARGAYEWKWNHEPTEAYREELLHTAAVAVAAIECLDRWQWDQSEDKSKEKNE